MADEHPNPGSQPASGAGPHPIRVMCVDDSPELVEMMRILLAGDPEMECVGILESADELVEVAALKKPDVVLLDLRMHGREPLEALQEVARTMPSVRVLGFSGLDDHAQFKAVIDAGGWGLLSKDAGAPAVLDAIRRVARGEIIRPRT